jgi:type IV pilus assembly protein PilN
MRVHLNLATKRLETHRRFLVFSSVGVLVAGILFMVLGTHFYSARKADADLRRRTEEIRAKLAKLEDQRTELDKYFQQRDVANLRERAAFLNSMIDARSFDWTQMFMDLERILPPGVRVISIEPKQDKGQIEVKLRIGASSDEAKLKFQQGMEDSKVFRNVRELHEFTPQAASGVSIDPLVVELTAVYKTI